MANLTESPVYDVGVYQIETTDPVSGGADGVSNRPGKNLANRTAYLKKQVDDILAGTLMPAGIAPLAGPLFTGDPRAPTPAAGDNDTSIATTQFVQRAVFGIVSKTLSGSANVTLTAVEAGHGVIALSGSITGNVSVIVPGPGRWIVHNAVTGAFTVTVRTATGTGPVVPSGYAEAVYCSATDSYLVGGSKAPLASPAFTGVPTVPTAAVATNTTQAASTAYVVARVAQDAMVRPSSNIASGNFDDFRAPGNYTFDPAPTSGTTPMASVLNWQMLVLGHVVHRQVELAFPYNSDRAFFRRRGGTAGSPTIGNWVELATGAGMTDALALKADAASPVLTGVPAIRKDFPELQLQATSGANLNRWRLVSNQSGSGTGNLVFQHTTDAFSANFTDALTLTPSGQLLTDSPSFSGTPTAPTASPGTNSTQLATTAFVAALGALKANVASPTFTGVPAAPTASPGTSTTQLATTAFVAAAAGVLDAAKAPIASPTFTGVPAAPTASAGTSTTQVATTAFVAALGALKANLASPALTGTPTAPTAAAGTSTTQLATTAFVVARMNTVGLAAQAVAGGLGDLNNAPIGGYWSVNGTKTQGESLNWPDTGMVGSTLLWFDVETFGVATRLTQIATQVFQGTSLSRQWVRQKQDAVWTSWREVCFKDEGPSPNGLAVLVPSQTFAAGTSGNASLGAAYQAIFPAALNTDGVTYDATNKGLTIPRSGTYLITLKVKVSATGSPASGYVELRKNSNGYLTNERYVAVALGSENWLNATATCYAVQGDLIAINCSCTAGTLYLDGAFGGPYLSITRIGG